MTTKAEREILLQGKDEVANLAMATLAERGWAIERRLKNVATRTYGPNGASIRIELDSEFQRYWLHANYWTEGSNILEATIDFFPAGMSADYQASKVIDYLAQVEKKINGSFAMRFCAN